MSYCITILFKFFCPRVHNFTNYNLSLSESYLLSLGLNFRPSPLPISVHSLDQLGLNIFFRDMGQSEHYAYAYHLVRSDWTPPICPPYIEIPLLAVRHELCAISPQQIKHKPNLSTHEFATLRKLFANKNIFILPSDKNLGPTIVTVHKDPMVGRPIVASTTYITTPASRFVDHCLSPILPSIPSYLKDSIQLIKLAGCKFNKEIFLVTADVTSLYTNIPLKVALLL